MSVYEGKVAGHKFKGSGTIANGYAWIYNSTTQQFELTDLTATYAPVGADYLVGTTQSGLTGEIVVGTAPGGELGGTWASPTVDATHSGSAHIGAYASIQAAGSAILGALYEVVVNLTDAEIKTLFSAPKQLLAAPGANLRYVVERLTIMLDSAAGAYAGGATVSCVQGGNQMSGTIAASLWTTAGAGRFGQDATFTQVTSSGSGNVAMLLTMAAANLTGGNAANKATVRVLYRILSTLPN